MKKRTYTVFGLVTAALAFPVMAERVITLEEALWLALDTDERIEIQRRDVIIAGHDVSRAWTIVSPRLFASARYERPQEELVRDEQVVVPEDSWRATLTASQPVFDGRVLPARRVGLAVEQAATQDLSHTIRTALFDVSLTYYNVLRAQKQMAVAQQTVELTEQEVSRATARFDAGEARRTEVLRAEVDASRAVRNLTAARSEFDVAKSDLVRRLGLTPDDSFSVSEPATIEASETEDLQSLYYIALEERQDLAAARLRAEAAAEQRTVIRREGWPTLAVEYNHRFVDPESFSSRNNTWDVAAVASYDFWDGGSRRLSRLQQEQRVDQSMLLVRELEKSIQLDVQEALLDLQTLRENLTTLHKEVDLAEENYRTLSEQARVGLATSLDVSTALNALTLARTELARQAYDLEVAKMRLEASIGRYGSAFISTDD